MAANVENMAYFGKTPWHNTGNMLTQEERKILAACMSKGGLDWFVDMVSIPLTLMGTQTNLDDFAKAFIRRFPDGREEVLSVVGPSTHPLQNVDAFNFFQPVIDAGLAEIETCGVLDNGRKVWALASLTGKETEVTKGDSVRPYIMLSNSHDGTLAVRIGRTDIRIVCSNTLAMAHRSAASKLLRVRHSKDVKKNVEALRDCVDMTGNEFTVQAEKYRFLASKGINQSDVRKYVKAAMGFIDNAETGKLATKSENILNDIVANFTARHSIGAELIQAFNARQEEEKQIQSDTGKNVLESILANMEEGKGSDLAGGTYWGVFNSVNEHLNYKHGHAESTRLNSLWFGTSNKTNEQALELAVQMADGKMVV